jgi:hypothetical protein
MKRHSLILVLPAFVAISMISPKTVIAQTPGSPISKPESIQDLGTHLTAEQKQQFDEAMKAFNAQRYADALPVFKELLKQLPGDAVLSKIASESALNTGDTSFALSALRPLTAADANDWQAAALLTRACAESGDATCRDSGIAHLLDLHRQGITPPGLTQYILERVKAGENTLLIRTSLEPWGPYKVYNLVQVSNSEGKMFLRITLESSDFDQASFAKEHPKEASEGLRRFSLDSYLETGLNSDGQRTQTHFSYKFFDGQPAYETVRAEFLKIANGKATPISSRTGLIVR